MRPFPLWRTSALVTVALLAVAGCGATPTGEEVASAEHGVTATPTIDPGQQAEKWAECMRTAGVTMVRNDEGQLVPDKDRDSFATIEAGYAACRSLAPVVASTEDPPTADQLDRLRRHAACMREHGLSDYPDPDPVTGGANAEAVLTKRDKYDPQLRAALDACQKLLGNSSPGVQGG